MEQQSSDEDSSSSETDNSTTIRKRKALKGSNTLNKTAKKEKIPPIILTSEVKEKIQFSNDMTKNIDPDMKFQYNRYNIKIFPSTLEAFHKTKEHLKDKQFYTYTPTSERTKHVVLKGLPNLDPKYVANELKLRGFEPKRCIVMKQKSPPPYTAPMYMVSFDSSIKINEIRAIKHIRYIKVRWDKYRRARTITQCRRCQEFGHGTLGCNQTPKCVKCAGAHLTESCDKKKGEHEAICANCSGTHPASYSGCPKFMERIELVNKQRENRQKLAQKKTPMPVPKPEDFPALKRTSTFSWDRINNDAPSRTEVSETSDLITDYKALSQELKELNKIMNLKEMIKTVRDLKEKLSKCTTQLERIEVLSELIKDDD